MDQTALLDLNATLEYEGDGKPIVFTVPEIQDKTFIVTMGGKAKGLIQ